VKPGGALFWGAARAIETPDLPVPVLNCGCASATAARATCHAKEYQNANHAIVLIVLWALGLVSGYAMGGLLHLLLVIALVVFALRFFTGRRIA